jgi:hypothetical protein
MKTALQEPNLPERHRLYEVVSPEFRSTLITMLLRASEAERQELADILTTLDFVSN